MMILQKTSNINIEKVMALEHKMDIVVLPYSPLLVLGPFLIFICTAKWCHFNYVEMPCQVVLIMCVY